MRDPGSGGVLSISSSSSPPPDLTVKVVDNIPFPPSSSSSTSSLSSSTVVTSTHMAGWDMSVCSHIVCSQSRFTRNLLKADGDSMRLCLFLYACSTPMLTSPALSSWGTKKLFSGAGGGALCSTGTVSGVSISSLGCCCCWSLLALSCWRRDILRLPRLFFLPLLPD